MTNTIEAIFFCLSSTVAVDVIAYSLPFESQNAEILASGLSTGLFDTPLTQNFKIWKAWGTSFRKVFWDSAV
jgi:hypothetical protein